MNKKQWTIPLSTLLVIGLAGCTSDNNRAGVNDQNNNPVRPMGYYSNENHQTNNYDFNDNDGPLTEMMDHTLGNEDQSKGNQFQTRDKNGNPKNPTTPLASKDRNFFQRDNRFSTSDMNYHSHLSQNIGNSGTSTSRNFQENVTNKIRKKVATVNNVQDVRSVAYGNSVIVSVALIDKSKAEETKRAIRNVVKPYVDGRTVTVITDEGTIGRDKNINNDVPQKEQR